MVGNVPDVPSVHNESSVPTAADALDASTSLARYRNQPVLRTRHEPAITSPSTNLSNGLARLEAGGSTDRTHGIDAGGTDR